MTQLDCSAKMNEAIDAILKWEAEHASLFTVDTRRECEKDWSPDYAIIELAVDSLEESTYIDVSQALTDVRKVASTVFGPRFRIVHGTKHGVKHKLGDLVCAFHQREIEIYRVRK